jgi:membrane protease YdiL (CAAX protease family)
MAQPRPDNEKHRLLAAHTDNTLRIRDHFYRDVCVVLSGLTLRSSRPRAVRWLGRVAAAEPSRYTWPLRTGTSLRDRIAKRPITSFLVLTFTFSYPLGIAFNFCVSSVVASGTLTATYLPRLLTVVGPGAAALIVAACGGGSIPVRSLVRACRVRARQLPLLISIIVVSVAIAGAAFVLSGISVGGVIRVATDHPAMLLAHVAVQVVIIGLGEEIGWRGWLLPSLAQGRSFAAAAAITGVVWEIWHGPVFLSSIRLALSFAVLLASLAAILAWLWLRSGGSVALAATAHGAANGPFVFLESFLRPTAGGAELVGHAFMVFAMLYAGIAAVIVVSDRHTWSTTATNAYGKATRQVSGAADVGRIE